MKLGKDKLVTNIQTTFAPFKHFFDREIYVQGFNAVPAHIYMGPNSAVHTIWQVLGYGYKKCVISFENDYCEYFYFLDDIKSVGNNFFKRHNKSYMKKMLELDAEFWKPCQEVISKKIPRIHKLSDKKLIDEYKDVMMLCYQNFGTSHLVEAIAITSDHKIKELLLKDLRNINQEKNFNKYISILTQPIRICFIHRENASLKKMINYIKRNKVKLQKSSIEKDKKLLKMMQEHLKEFFWIKSTWADSVEFTLDMLIHDLKLAMKEKKTLEVKSKNFFEGNLKKKSALMKKLGLSKELAKVIEVTDVFTYWQDDRKIEMLTLCWALQRYVNELSKRINIKPEHLNYVMMEELDKLHKFDDQILAQRRKGCAMLYEKDMMGIISGAEYRKFRDFLKQKEEKKKEWEIMNGQGYRRGYDMQVNG